MHIAIAGLGLIGGSFARTIKAKTFHTVSGYDISPQAMHQALSCGALDDTVTDGNFSQVDLVLVALYPADAVEFIRTHAHTLKNGAVIVDLCGVKRIVCQGVRDIIPPHVTFIGGHPMAGKESSNFVNSSDSLFEGASMILTPFDSTPNELLEEVKAFFRSLGFGHVVITTDVHHDEVIAYTSQLAHVVSSAYIKSPTAREYMGFSAGSFKDMTRVAKLNEYMWTELFLDNRDYLARQIDTVIDNLKDFRRAIAEGDAETLRDMLREGREIKERLG